MSTENRVKHNFDWRYIKALNELYTNKKTKLKVSDHPFFSTFLMKQKRMLSYQMGNHSFIVAESSFKTYYENELKDDFDHYFNFLNSVEIGHDGRNKFTEYDLRTLIFIHEHKATLKDSLTTERTFSSKVFKGSKYLGKRSGLKKAVCRILGINDFPENDPKNNQIRIVVDCPDAEIIVLCENMNNLKMPWQTKKHNAELWYVGGNNTAILDEISERYLNLPIFYSCDWDYHGLSIYSRIKKIFSDKSISITLLQPDNIEGALPVNSEDHYSEWLANKELSGLNSGDFNEKQIDLINNLIGNNLWIEEESYDLIRVLTKNITKETT